MSRRGFVAGAGLIGMTIPVHSGMVPTTFASDDVLAGKHGLTLVNDRSINAEMPAHLLDDAIPPTTLHNGLPPVGTTSGPWAPLAARSGRA